MADIEFVNGLNVKAPRDGAPDFVKASISIKVNDLIAWLNGRYSKGDEWVNLDVKEARSGKWYAAVNTYKPKVEGARQASASNSRQGAQPDMDDVPFSSIGRGISGHSV